MSHLVILIGVNQVRDQGILQDSGSMAYLPCLIGHSWAFLYMTFKSSSAHKECYIYNNISDNWDDLTTMIAKRNSLLWSDTAFSNLLLDHRWLASIIFCLIFDQFLYFCLNTNVKELSMSFIPACTILLDNLFILNMGSRNNRLNVIPNSLSAADVTASYQNYYIVIFCTPFFKLEHSGIQFALFYTRGKILVTRAKKCKLYNTHWHHFKSPAKSPVNNFAMK